MAQPTFLVAGVVDANGFGLNCAVQVDFGTSGAVGVVLQGYIDGGASAITVISATAGGTMTGGTAGTNSLGQATNIGGTISGGTALTLESNVTGVSFLGSAGHARAARGVVTLTGVQWVQIRAGLVSDGTPDGNGKPTLVVSLYEGVSDIPAGAVFVQGSTSPSQAVTTTANDVAAMVFFTSATDSYTASASAPTVQRIRGTNTDAQGYNSLVWDEPGVAGTTTLQGSITGAFTPTVAGTKWVIQGTAGGDTTAPTITSVVGTGGAGSSSGSFSSDEAGTAFWKATLTNTPETVPAYPAAMTGWTPQSMSSGPGTIASLGTTPGTYWLQIVGQDAANNRGAAPSVSASSFTITASPATAISLTGPSSGVNGVASTNFTVGANGAITGSVVVTPSAGAGGGSFSPTSVTLTSGSPTGTFTYTPASVGSKSIAVTNNGGLTNPAAVTYTVSAAPATQIVLPLAGAPNLTGLDYAVWSQARTRDLTAPIVKGSTAAISGGSCTLSIAGLGLAQGAVCWVEINNSDGTTTQDPMFGYSGPAVAS